MIRLKANAQRLIVVRADELTSGTVGETCEFIFSSDWTGLEKTAVFTNGGTEVSKDQLLTGNSCTIPWECLTMANVPLTIAVYGAKSNTRVIPTIYAEVQITEGADPSGDESYPPTADIVAQLQAADTAEATARVEADAEEQTFREDADADLQEQIDTKAEAEDLTAEIARAQAAEQAGTESIEAETEARKAADTTLEGKIESEANSRESADTTLQESIEAETTARTAADTTLQGNIDTEASTRETADTKLQKNIDDMNTVFGAIINAVSTSLQNDITAEQTARQDADSQLNEDIADHEERITAIENEGTGWSSEAVHMLITILKDGVYGSAETYTQRIPQLNALLGGDVVHCTGITLDQSTISMHNGATATLVATITPEDCTDTIAWSSSDENVITVSDGVITSIMAGSATITATCGDYSATCAVTVAETVTYSITNNLTHMTTSSDVTKVEENGYYSSTLSVEEGDYELSYVTVMMGGTDITTEAYSNYNILIQNVTGDVVITGVANAVSYVTDLYTYANKLTAIDVYEDEGVTQIGTALYSSYSLIYTKHDIDTASKFTITISNDTDSDITTGRILIGSIPTELNDNSVLSKQCLHVHDGKQISNSSGTLASGETIVASVSVRAGRRPVIAMDNSIISTVTVKVKGSYSYTEYGGTLLTWAYSGKYQSVTYYTGATTDTDVFATKNNYVTYATNFTAEAGKTYRRTFYAAEDQYQIYNTIEFGLASSKTDTVAFNAPQGYTTANKYMLPLVPLHGDFEGIDNYIIISHDHGSDGTLGLVSYIEEVTA